MFVLTVERVSILKVPDAFSLGFVVLELTLEVDTVGVDPATFSNLTLLPLTEKLHAGFLEQVSTSAFLVTEAPPA